LALGWHPPGDRLRPVPDHPAALLLITAPVSYLVDVPSETAAPVDPFLAQLG